MTVDLPTIGTKQELMSLAQSPSLWEKHDASDGINLLTKSLYGGWLDVAIVLVRSGYDVDRDNLCGSTALRAMVFFGNIIGVVFLLGAGAAVNGTDGDDLTPLEEAVVRDRIEIAGILLRGGADPNLRAMPCSAAYVPRSVEMREVLIASGWRGP